MKVCFFGLGSIGQKHLKNLKIVLDEKKEKYEIHAFRSKKNSNKNLDVDREIFSFEELENDYDIIFITNPTSLHFITLEAVVEKSKNIFIEKPLFDHINYDLNKLKLNRGIYYVASPLRYTGIVEKIKEIIKNKYIYSVRAICSSYLPDWRVNQDYRKIYSAIKELGGGVSIDLIHEWDYLTYLFGFPDKVYNIQGKYSHLEINSEDISIYIAKYKDKLLELHLDYFGRYPKREIEIYMKDDILIGDFIKKEIRFKNSNQKFSFHKVDMYIEEMKWFINKILCHKLEIKDNYLTHSYKVLEVILKTNCSSVNL